MPGAPAQPVVTDLRPERIARRLRLALQRGEVAVHYQPVVELPSGRILGAEALARWTDDELGVVPPDVFIAVAESTGLIRELGSAVLHQACLDSLAWSSDDQLAGAAVAVNVSAVQLDDDDIVATVAGALAQSGLPAHRLCLEITETAAIDDIEACIRRLDALRALGVRIALDDYGTGHSSLTMLRRLPVDVVKIDRSFVEQVTTDARDAVLVRLVIDTAHSFGLRVCAEGIETESQARQLIAMGADRAQGWLFGRPEPASAELTAKLINARSVGIESDSQPDLLLGGTEELVVVTSADFRIRYISASVHAMLGYVPAEALGASVLDFLDVSATRLLDRNEEIPSGNGQYRVRHRDGSTRWLASRGQALAEVGGRGQEFLFIVRDITPAVEAQTALAESEAKFREAFDGAPIGMAINRLDGSFLDVNQALAELLGYSTEQMMQLTVADITCPDDQAADALNTDALVAGDAQQVSVDKRYVHASGRTLPVRVRASIVSDEGSGQAYIVAHVLPLGTVDEDARAPITSDDKAIPSSREPSWAALDLAFDAAPCGVAVADSAGHFVAVNDRLCALFGRDRAEILGRSSRHFTHPDDLDQHARAGEAIRYAADGSLRVEKRYLRPDGSTIWVELRLSHATGPDGTEWTIGHMYDLTVDRSGAAATADPGAILSSVARIMRSIQQGEDARTAIVRSLVTLSNATFAFVAEPIDDQLVVTASTETAYAGFTLPLDAPTATAIVYRTGQPLLVRDVQHSALVSATTARHGQAEVMLFAPIRNRNGVSGVLSAGWTDPAAAPSSAYGVAVTLLADQAGITLSQSAMLDELSSLATTDQLTGLPNRRGWDSQLNLLQRNLQPGQQVFLALVDLDNFKVFNDRFGHHEGDRLLRDFARAARTALGDRAVFARWGGEEFTIALACTNWAEAESTLQAVLQSVPQGQTCSIGYAQHIDDLAVAETLRRADQALYRAKDAGRNRIRNTS